MTEFLNIILKKISIFWICIIGTMTVTSCASQGVTSALQTEVNDSFFVDITFEGGSGKAYIKSPVEITKTDGKLTAKFIWSSKNYDYMVVNGIKYENENDGGESTFTVEIDNITDDLTVIGDTVAMSVPHEIEYKIIWGEKSEEEQEQVTGGTTNRDAVKDSLEKAGLTLTATEELRYAKEFSIEQYGDYYYISIENSGDYIVVPQGADAPDGLPDDTVVLKQPLNNTYLVSTSAMDLVNACGALDMIKLSGTKESDWYIDDAKEAMHEGNIIYAGKYRAPDYELLLNSGCNFALENTMIYHEPAVKEKLQELGIPVLVETSSYEQHPLGRLEWIKLYGVLFGKKKEAEDFFNKQFSIIDTMLDEGTDTGKSVAFFHVTANGMINVRKSGDYITKMIELAGGHYALPNAGEGENALSTMNMQMEDFYTSACDADIIIYNSTIGGEIASIDELTSLNPLFADFKAVKNKRVYCTDRSLFQQITKMAEFMQDLNDVFNDKDTDYSYLNKLE